MRRGSSCIVATVPCWILLNFLLEKRTPAMGQNACTRITFSALALAVSLLVLLCCTALPVVHAQTKPGAPSAPPITVSVIEVSPKALPLYTEYTGTTDALDTAEIRARVD